MQFHVRVEFLPNKNDIPTIGTYTKGNPLIQMSFKHPLSVGHIIFAPNNTLPPHYRVVMILHSTYGDTLIKAVPV